MYHVLPKPQVCRLFLIRHGATAANLQRPYILQGRTLNGPLSETGITQAQATRDFLQSFPLSSVHCSPMLRAKQTAEIIAEPHKLPLEMHDDLIEVHVGDWESMSWDKIMEANPEQYEQFMASPGTTPYLGGESYHDVCQRAFPAFEAIAQQHLGKSIAVVAHNVVNRSILSHLLGIEINKAKDIVQKNCCVNVIDYKQGTWSVATLNSAFHLPVEAD